MGACISGEGTGRPTPEEIMAANMATLRQRDQDRDIEAAQAIAREKRLLRNKALPSLENYMSSDFIHVDTGLDEDEGDDTISAIRKESNAELMLVGAEERDALNSSLRSSKREKRQKAKKDADSDQKWMIFRDLDAFDEADMVKVARFMESVLKVHSQLPAKRENSSVAGDIGHANRIGVTAGAGSDSIQNLLVDSDTTLTNSPGTLSSSSSNSSTGRLALGNSGGGGGGGGGGGSGSDNEDIEKHAISVSEEAQSRLRLASVDAAETSRLSEGGISSGGGGIGSSGINGIDCGSGLASPSRSIMLDRSMSTGNIDISKINFFDASLGGGAKDDYSTTTNTSSLSEKANNSKRGGESSPELESPSTPNSYATKSRSLINTEDAQAAAMLDGILRSDVVITPTTALNVRQRSPSIDSRDSGSMDGSSHGRASLRNGKNALKGEDGTARASSAAADRFDLYDFDLPPGFVTASVAKSIIDVYKQGGRLSMRAVHKLLRLCYRAFMTLGNTSEISIGPDERMTIVGDIHGQLSDLFYILDHSGLPNKRNKYIFNGDFVDRGPNGVEVMCVMMALYLGNPGQVSMNRGNHEDFAICCVYGFQQECCTKYDEVTFGMFVEVFNWLPLFASINRQVFVLHGGLFHNKDVTLRELNAIRRTEFSLKDLPESGESLDNAPRDHKEEFYKQLQRDALWSDPSTEDGLAVSNRGAGVMFGPDIARNFCDLNGIKMIVRSHECCRSGFELPYRNCLDSDDRSLVATIFSASNYGGGGNSAAYMVFTYEDPSSHSPTSDATPASASSPTRTNNNNSSSSSSIIEGPGSPESTSKYGGATVTSHSTQITPVSGTSLQYEVHYFAIDSQEEEIYDTINKLADQFGDGDGDDGASVSSHISGVSLTSDLSIHELILRKKPLLLKAFELADFKQQGCVTVSTWANCMHNVLSLSIDWVVMAGVLVDEDCMIDSDQLPGFSPPPSSDTPTSAKSDDDQSSTTTLIDYRIFLETFSLSLEATESEENGAGASSSSSNNSNSNNKKDRKQKSVTGKLVDSLYAHHNELLAVFRFFDVKKDNVISKEEFREGCRFIRQMSTGEEGSPNAAGGGEDSEFDKDCDMLLEIMNLNGSGFIDINDFLEMFRVSDAMQRKIATAEGSAGASRMLGVTGGQSHGAAAASGEAAASHLVPSSSSKVIGRRSSYSAEGEPARRMSLKAVQPPAPVANIHGVTVHGD